MSSPRDHRARRGLSGTGCEQNFNFLVEQALGKVRAETEEEQEMLDEIENRMRQLRFRAGD
jgi:hypothetical protein